jgi:hypothetical protein
VSARTAVEVADRRRDLAQHDIRAADPLGRAAAYALAAQQAPALVLGWSWVVSLVRDGVRPARVREALADALTGPVVTCAHCLDGFGLDDIADGDVLLTCTMCARAGRLPAGLAVTRPDPTPEDR